MPRHAVLTIDLSAITANLAALRERAPGAQLCAVVKADAYGHGAVEVARAAVDAGARWLAVALVEEGIALRDAGLEAPILVLSEPSADSMADAYAAGLVPSLYTPAGIDAAGRAANAGGEEPWEVHLKLDTGMHRAGVLEGGLGEVIEALTAQPSLRLAGVFTHLATADDPARPETAEQLALFDTLLARVRRAVGERPLIVHAANSAATIAMADAHHDLVRVGIAMYGIDPSPELAGRIPLVPALSLTSEVALVKELGAGDGISYGLRHVCGGPSTVAVVPLGYADGVPRRLGELGAEVLIGGVRRPIRGVVTMDQLVVEVTGGPEVHVGDPVVLIGSQGVEQITAQEWAAMLDTIPYEIVCGFSQRLPRRYVRTRG